MLENKQQELAINKIKGPCLILAGAGTGKTYTIRKKIKYLVENKHYLPEEILCLTFSNEATNNLKKKLVEDIKDKANYLTIKTFHSFCSEIIKENSAFFKIKVDFKIIQPDDSKVLVHKYFKIDPYLSNRYINTIQNCKDFGITIDNTREYIKNKLEPKLKEYTHIKNIDNYYKKIVIKLKTVYINLDKINDKEIRRIAKEDKKVFKKFIELYDNYKKFNEFINIWGQYENLKKNKNYLDYGDLNKLVLEYFKEMDSEKYIEQYKYVFIDEFQDTNKLQFELINYIAKHKNITIVGDMNQSIYGFRGAYKDSFEHFERDFNINKEKDIFKLDKSYRSPNTVLNIAFDLIKHNYEKATEDCIKIQNADNIQGNKVNITSFEDQYEEARYISDTVEKEIEKGTKLEEIAILIRTHKQAEVIKQALDLKRIPYVYAGRTNLLEFAEIKTIISYLSILNNLITKTATGDQSWWYLFHYSNTLDPEDSIKIGIYLKKNKSKKQAIDLGLLDASIELSEKGKNIVNRVVNKLRSLINLSNKPLPELVLDICELIGLNRRYTYKRSTKNTEHLLNLKKFYEITKNFYEFHSKDLPSFIEYLEILDKLEVNIQASRISNLNAVRLMTIHACKGLEFKTVIASNFAEKRFPVTRTYNAPLIPKELISDRKAEIDTIKEENKDLEPDELEKLIKIRIKDYEKDILLYEERRLCYVAFTRAEENLIITYARSYNSEPDSTKQSMFLDEINYIHNENILFTEDKESLSTIIAPNSKSEKYKSLLKEQLIDSLDSEDLNLLIQRLSKYFAVRENNINIQEIINNTKINTEELKKDILKYQENKNSIKFNRKEFTFSVSSINNYLECPKKFEIQNIYQMPAIGIFDDVDTEEGTGSALDRGSYLHEILEIFVKEHKETIEDLEEIAKNLLETKFFEKISKNDYENTIELGKVFLQRNLPMLRSSKESRTEIDINLKIGDYKFTGKVDRVDYLSGDREGFVDIIDYKTNKASIDTQKRKIQLGIYAIGLQEQGMKINKLSLDMLKLDNPIEMLVDKDNQDQVTAKLGCNKASNFKLSELKQYILDTCSHIESDYETEFKTIEDRNKCKFCGYKFYCPKWKV